MAIKLKNKADGSISYATQFDSDTSTKCVSLLADLSNDVVELSINPLCINWCGYKVNPGDYIVVSANRLSVDILSQSDVDFYYGGA